MFAPESHILIVDDMMTMRKMLAKACKEMGFNKFTEAADGREAWEKLSNADPGVDVIISDWNMPEVTGLDFLKRVRGDGKFKTLPFLMVTAENDKSQVMEALKAGVSNYVVKPFTTDGIKEKLEEILQISDGNF